MAKINYKCTRCRNGHYESGEIRAAGGLWTKIFNIQNRKFLTISCKKCGYTEFYNKKGTKTIENVFDFFTN